MLPQTTISTNYYYPMYIHTDDRSEAEKCMDRPDFQDLMNKQLKNEELNDEDIERVNECIEERRGSSIKISKALAVVILIIFILGLILLIAA